jgi:hypothetical protein
MNRPESNLGGEPHFGGTLAAQGTTLRSRVELLQIYNPACPNEVLAFAPELAQAIA